MQNGIVSIFNPFHRHARLTFPRMNELSSIPQQSHRLHFNGSMHRDETRVIVCEGIRQIRSFGR